MKLLKINVEDILKETGASKGFCVDITLKDINWQGEPLQFRTPIKVEGNITNTDNILLLNVAIRGSVTLQCVLCLEQYEHNLDFSFEARLARASSDISNMDVDAFSLEGNEFNLLDIIWEFLLLEIPIRKTCQENCKGICPECGTNLNKQTCKCKNSVEDDPDLTLDERLQLLKDHFSKQGKEV